MMYYAGVGSRETPAVVLAEMEIFASYAVELGLILRSGAAPGADTAFENGCDFRLGKKQIFLPWKGFNGHQSQLYIQPPRAYELAQETHPSYPYLKRPARSLIARNMMQVLGENLDEPAKFVICYTADGCESHTAYSRATGGTGTAISLASKNNIPIFNMKNKGRYLQAIYFMEDLANGTNV